MISASSSGDEAAHAPSTPARKLKACGSGPYSPINERKALRRRRRPPRNSHIAVREGHGGLLDAQAEKVEPSPKRRQVLKQEIAQAPSAAFHDALVRLPAGFGEDFFMGYGHSKVQRGLALNAAAPGNLKTSTAAQVKPSEHYAAWIRLLKIGFSVLVHGVGSKKQLLEDFAQEALKPLGVVRIHMRAFDARFSLCECLRSLLEQVYPDAPRQGTSADALATAVRTAAAVSGSRPLCLLVHNIESMAQHHIVVLSNLSASPGIHLIASIDNIWAPLAWDARCQKNFNFCRQEAHTSLGYEVEVTARHPRGLPPWSGLGQDRRRTPKASLSLVLRSLTNNHRELVQAMAERQLESDSQTGISMSALLKITNDRMIAATVPKLKSLLNELRDHEVVVQRGCSSAVTAQVLFYLPFDEKTLERLADGQTLDSDDEGEENCPTDNVAEEDVVA